MPHKILFTIPNFITAGSGRAMLNIVRGLDRGHFAPAVCVLKKGGYLDREVEDMGIPLLEAQFTVPALPYPGLPLRAWQAAKYFRSYRFELWHSFNYSEDYTESLVAYLSGAGSWVYTKKNMNWGSRAWKLRSSLASRIVAENSDMLSLFFASSGFNRKTRLIPRGVDMETFSPLIQPRLGLRIMLGLYPGIPVIAILGHLMPIKGHSTLLEAMTQITDAHLLVAGKPMDADYSARLKEQVYALNLSQRVHFLGGVDDVAGMLAEVEIYVLPTLKKGEGFGVALLEAMACGKACIASDVPGPRDMIVHGKSGLLVPPEDPVALARAIKTLLSNPALRLQLGTTARRRAEEHFSIQREVAAHEALYLDLLEGDRAW